MLALEDVSYRGSVQLKKQEWAVNHSVQALLEDHPVAVPSSASWDELDEKEPFPTGHEPVAHESYEGHWCRRAAHVKGEL